MLTNTTFYFKNILVNVEIKINKCCRSSLVNSFKAFDNFVN